jgi:beta-glucosidase
MLSSVALVKPSLEERINALLGRMTLEEKIGQMNQTPRLDTSDQDAIRRGEIGSSIFASSAWAGKDMPSSAKVEFCVEHQRVAVTESRMGIPILFGRDVIHGHRTVFPIPLGQAAAWHPELVEQAAAITAREATADGVKWAFSPMLDIARDPRWGRIAEGYGEDPYLASANAVAAVRGFQGGDCSQPDRVAACAKHYAGYGGAEGGRDYDHVEMSVRTLRDVYLPPFRAAVDTGVAAIMSGFHDMNGVPVAANRFMLTDILRGEWGFAGLVVSDWNAVGELMVHGIARDANDAASLAVQAGVDMDMVSGVYLRCLAALVRNGRVPPEVIDEAARRILRVKFLAGLFDQPYPDPLRAERVTLAPEHRAVARQLAQETLVLLKNEGDVLPLGNQFHRLAVMGPLAHAQVELFGAWTLDGQGRDVTSIADAMRELAPKDVELIVTTDKSDEAIARVRAAGIAVVVVGEHPARSGEASSISTLDLPAGQREMIQAVHDAGVPLVLVVLAGRPLAIAREAALAQAVLYAWHPGVEGGHAIADVLYGRAAPGGRLPVTLPRTVGQVPIYYSRKNTGRPSQPGGSFLNGYIDLPATPLYPFGFGLGYTRLDYRNLRIERSGAFETSGAQISAEVTNVGASAGTEVAQLYVRDLVGSVTRPVKELKGFARVTLAPGETQRVTFTLRPEDLMFAGLDDKPIFEPGDFHIWIGPDSTQGLRGELSV